MVSKFLDQHDQASNSMEIALRAFDDRNIGWFYVDKRRRTFLGPAGGENLVARAVDDAWRASVDDGSLSEIRHYIAIAFRPFRGTMGFFDEISASMMDEHNSLPAAILKTVSSTLRREKGIEKMQGKIVGATAAFESQIGAFLGTLTTLNARRLVDEELLCGLSDRVNLATPRNRVACGPLPDYLNTLLVTDTLKRADGGVLEFVGATRSQFVQMLSIKGLPQVINNADVEALLTLQGDFSVVQQYRFLDREKAKAYINDCEHHYRSSIKSPMTQAFERLSGNESDSMDMGMLALAEDSSAALAELTGDGVNFGYHTMAVMAIGRDRRDLDITLKGIAGLYSNLGYGVVREVVNQVGAFCATIPGGGDSTVRTSMVATQSVFDIEKVKLSAAFNDNVRTRIYLPSAKAKSAARVYIDYLGLSEEDVDVLANATPKRHYLIEQNGRVRLIDVLLPPEILAHTRSDPRAKLVFKKLLEEGFVGAELSETYVKTLLNH